MKKLFLLYLFALIANISQGQGIGAYTFSAFSNPYTASTGTLITTPSGTTWGGGGIWDDCWYPTIPIGFTFTYGCNDYTTLTASQNCWAVLGQTLSTYVNTFDNDLSNTSTGGFGGFNLPRPILAPLWTDVMSVGACLRYSTAGTAPNRIFTLEWYNIGFYGSSYSGLESVEIILYETTNVIDFAYNYLGPGTYSFGRCAIGITDGVGPYPTVGAQNFWSLNGTGPSPTASMVTESKFLTGQPASNQVYRWNPNCSGTPPTCTVSATVTTGCSSYTSVLSLVGLSSCSPGMTYQWQSSPDGSSWTNIPGATNATYTATVIANTYYRCIITCSGSGLFSTTAGVELFLNSPPAAIGGPTVVCVGSTITLTDATPGGTWSSLTPTVATVGSTTGIVTGVSPGTSVIKYTLPTGCFTSVTVNVVSAPLPISGPSSVCVGQTITLSDATPGGTWSSSDITKATVGALTGVVTGVATGVVTITYSLGTCYSTTSITVNPSPVAITGPNNVCVGSTITLSDATPGGAWASSNPAVATITPGGLVTGVSPGIVTISYTLPAGCAATYLVTVNPLPNPITGIGTLCTGDSSALFDVGGGTWTSSNIAVATIGSSSGMLHGISAGTATITYTLPTGCRTTFPITVNALPSPILGPDSLCIGATITLTDASPGGFWSSSDPSIAFVNPATGLVTGISSGVAIISYTTGCSATFSVTVNPSPGAISGIPTVCVGFTTSLFDGGGGTWSSSNPAVATVGSTSGVVTGISPGVVTISYTLPTGCSATIVVTVNAAPAPIGGPSSVCVGMTATETDATPSGTWSSSNPAIASIVPGTGLVTGIVPGVVTITYTLGTGCTATKTFTVNSSTAPITGPTSVCVGSTITLSDIVGGGIWTSVPTTVATIGSLTGIVTGVNPGIATITYSLGTGCTATTTITVNPLPAVIAGPSTVCVGLTMTLTDATPGGTWSSSLPGTATVGSTTGVVTGVASGVTVITYSLGTGCNRTKSVTVNPAPGLYTITGGGSYCSGGTGVHIGLSGSAIGTTYQLFNGVTPVGGAIAGTGTPLDFGLFTAAGTYTVVATITITSCTRTMTGSVVITINPLPAPITGPTNVCVGSTITLGDATVGGTWTSGDITIATVGSTTGLVTGISAGVVNISYTLGTGCARFTTITVNALPTISGPTALCPATTITMTATPGPGTWLSSTPAVATITPTTGIVSGISTGATVITYTVTSTGCKNTVTVNVTAGPTLISGPSTVCVGTTVTLTDGVTGGTWTSSAPGVATVGSSSGVVTGIAVGTVTITYSLGTGCIVTKPMTVNASPAAISGTLVICIGNTTTLTDPTPGGTWSSTTPAVGTVSTGGVVTGISAGTTLISYTLAGCPALAIVTVNPLPTAIGGTLTVCVGQTTTLTDAITGGSWTSASPGVATIGTSSGIVTGVTPGTSIITYSLGTGCTTTATVTVNPLPAAIAGPGTVCQGLTIILTDATPGGTWSSGTPAVATNVGGAITGVTPGTSVISYTLSLTGCAATKTVTVTPVPTPIIGSTGVCVGQTTVLSDAVLGGTWTSSNPSVATIGSTSGIVTGISTGTATIIYTVGGCSTSTTVNVTASPAPITGPSNVCVGSTINLLDASPGGTWSSGNPAVATISPTGVVTGVASGTAIISYTFGTGCISIKPIVVNPWSAINGTPVVCVGQMTSLSDTSLGGTWSSSTPGVATVTTYSGIVTGISGGTTTISYTMPTGCFATMVVTVNPIPAPIVILGGPVLCVGQTRVVLDSTIGGAWSISNPAVATFAGGTVTGISAGTATITYVLGTGCYVTLTVTVNGLPSVITGPSDVCLGGTITLHDSVAGGMWTSSDPAVATIGTSSGVVTGVTLGTVTIDYTLGTGCSVTKIVNVDSLPGAITGSLAVCVGQTTTLSDPTPGGSWSSSAPLVAPVGPFSGIVFGNSPGISTITYSLGTGCNVTAVVTVNLLPVGISGSTNVCIGATTLLTDGTPGGTWSSSDPAIATIGSTTGIATGVAVGAVTITYSLGTGCTAMTTINVLPSPAPVTGSPLICIGSTTTLSDATPGGTWNSSNPAIAPVSPAGVVSGVALGTAIISYTVGCTSTMVVTVNPLPTPISGSTNVCVGSTTTLIDGVTGGVWTSTDPAIATVGSSSGVVTGIVAGTVTIVYSLGAGCTATIDITVNPLPSPIYGPDQVCATQTITLFDAQPGGVWSSGTPGVATIGTSGIVTGVTAGVATISYTVGCSTTYLVTVNPMPTAISGSANVCLGGTTTLSDGVTGGVWTSSDPAIASVGSGSGIVTGMNLGVATITYMLPAGCYVTKVVNVYPLPTVFIVSGGGSYCAGGTGEHVYLSGSTVGVNYMLYRGVTATGTFAGTGSPLDFGLQTVAGVYTVIGTSTATGCSVQMADSAVITIIPSVVPAVNVLVNPGDTVCAGTSVTFTPVPVNGGTAPTYLWDVNGFPVAFSTTYTFIPANGDAVTVTMTSNAVCPMPANARHSVTMNVMPYADPTVSLDVAPNDTVCKGTVVTLSAVTTYAGAAPTFIWMKNGDVAGSASSTLAWIPDNGDVVYCILHSSYPCRTKNADTSANILITVDTPEAPRVVINADPGTMVQLGQTVTLTAVVTGGTTNLTYQWYKNGIILPGETTAVYSSNSFNYPNPDSVTCMVTTHDVCTVTGFEWTYINVANVGVKTLSQNGDIVVVPNPNKGEFVIKGALNSVNDEDVSLEITDVLGQVVYRNTIAAKGGKLNENIKLSGNLANGMYMLSVRSATENKVFHMVIEQ